jgi:hypothetical protein
MRKLQLFNAIILSVYCLQVFADDYMGPYNPSYYSESPSGSDDSGSGSSYSEETQPEVQSAPSQMYSGSTSAAAPVAAAAPVPAPTQQNTASASAAPTQQNTASALQQPSAQNNWPSNWSANSSMPNGDPLFMCSDHPHVFPSGPGTINNDFIWKPNYESYGCSSAGTMESKDPSTGQVIRQSGYYFIKRKFNIVVGALSAGYHYGVQDNNTWYGSLFQCGERCRAKAIELAVANAQIQTAPVQSAPAGYCCAPSRSDSYGNHSASPCKTASGDAEITDYNACKIREAYGVSNSNYCKWENSQAGCK